MSGASQRRGFLAGIVGDADRLLEVPRAVRAGFTPESRAHQSVREAAGLVVERSIGHCAYGDTGTREDFRHADRTLVAKVPEGSSNGFFSKQEFAIDLDAGMCRCPAGRTGGMLRSRKVVDGRGGVRAFGVFHLPSEECRACALRPRCTRAIRAGRSVQLQPQEAELAGARELQQSPASGGYGRLRQIAEYRIARLIQPGARQSRFLGRRKRRLQLLMAAAVANLTLVWSQAERPCPQEAPPVTPQAADRRPLTRCLHAPLSDVSHRSRWIAVGRTRASWQVLVESRS